MNECRLTQLKTIVERAVRPVQVSTFSKRQMREELLAHVSGVFEEELARQGDELAALERTALRFGPPAEVTGQLQDSVPAVDRVRQFWEGHPGQSTRRVAFRLAWVSGALAALLFAVALAAVGSFRELPPEALVLCLCGVLALPVYLTGLTFLADWMEKALNGPTGASRLKVALVAAGSWLFTNLGCAGLAWRTWSSDLDHLTVIVWILWLTPMALLFPYALARSAADRRRYHEEWARLDIA